MIPGCRWRECVGVSAMTSCMIGRQRGSIFIAPLLRGMSVRLGGNMLGRLLD